MFLFGAENAADQIKMRRRMGCLVDGPALYADLTAWQNLKVQCLQRGLDEVAIAPYPAIGGSEGYRRQAGRKILAGDAAAAGAGDCTFG